MSATVKQLLMSHFFYLEIVFYTHRLIEHIIFLR